MKTKYIRLRLAQGNGPGKRKLAHVKVAEIAFGKPLPKEAVVHHVDENGSNNRNDNLAIFPNRGYHKAIHARLKIKQRGGNPNTQKICAICKSLKSKEDFYKNRCCWDGLAHRCKACEVALMKERRFLGIA